MTRSRRSLSTLVLRDDIKEKILADLKEFLASEEWYTLAGVPHRRGTLLLVSYRDVLFNFCLGRIPIVWQTWNRQELNYSRYGNISFTPYSIWLWANLLIRPENWVWRYLFIVFQVPSLETNHQIYCISLSNPK